MVTQHVVDAHQDPPRISENRVGSPLGVIGGGIPVSSNQHRQPGFQPCQMVENEFHLAIAVPLAGMGAVTELTNGRVYVFQVRAVSGAGAGASSHQVEVTPGVGRLEFAHFANGSSITSELVLVNVFARPIRPWLYFYNREGERIAAEFW